MNRAANFSNPSTHSRFGGSSASRVLRCPASVGLVQQVPAYLRKVSAHAERGVALHEALASLIDESEHSVERVVGKTFNAYTVTRDDAKIALAPALAYANSLLDAPGAEFFLEARLAFPTITGAFGTADLIIRIRNTAHILDFKFGAGVRVLALSPAEDDPTADVLNSQLMFYACSARYSRPEFFAGVEDIVLTIVQPTSIDVDAEMVSSVTVTNTELDAFIVAYRAACEEALSDTPRLERGSWCRFCAARACCPAHTRPLLDLAQFVVPTASAVPKEAYLQILADGLNLVDAVKDIRTALHDQAKRALQNGDNVPGYALSAGRAERHWFDESTALATLQSVGFYYDDIIEANMRSPKQVELRAKARGLEVPKDLIGSRRSGVSLVRSENVRAPVLGRAELARTFSEALEALLEE
jgi:hypothetical protein